MADKTIEVFFAVINPGGRIALVPPGTPGPYQVLLGFVSGGNEAGRS